MKRTISRNALYQIEKDFNALAKNNFGIYLILESRINEFKKKNKLHLEVMHSRFVNIQSKYVKKDNHGNFLTKEYEGKMEWDWVESYVDIEAACTLTRDEVRNRFSEELDPFFNQTITIEY